MKILIIFVLLCVQSQAQELKVFQDTPKSQKVLKSIELIKKEKQEALAMEAKLKEQERLKQEKEREKEAKIEKNFAKKSEIQEVAKKETNVKVDEKGADFFNTLKDDSAKPISIE